MRAPFQLPSRSAAANSRSWPVVRPTSPVSRGSGRPVSRWARSAAASPTAAISSAASWSRRARCSAGADRKGSNADSASSAARATSFPSANWNPGSSALPSAGSTEWKAPASPTTASPPMYMAPTTAALADGMWSSLVALKAGVALGAGASHAKGRPRPSDRGVAVPEPAQEPARHQPPLEDVAVVEQPLVRVGGGGVHAVREFSQPGQVEDGPAGLAPVEQPQFLLHGRAGVGQPLEPVRGVDAVPAAGHHPGRQPVGHRPADQRARNPLAGALALRQRQAELRAPRVPGGVANIDPVQGRVGAVDPADVMNVIHHVPE